MRERWRAVPTFSALGLLGGLVIGESIQTRTPLVFTSLAMFAGVGCGGYAYLRGHRREGVTHSVRRALSAAGCVPIGEVRGAHGSHSDVRVGGMVRAVEADLGSEDVYIVDETGGMPVIVSDTIWATTRDTALAAMAMAIDGTVEHRHGESTLHAKALTPILLSNHGSRRWADWRGWRAAWPARSVWDDLPPGF